VVDRDLRAIPCVPFVAPSSRFATPWAYFAALRVNSAPPRRLLAAASVYFGYISARISGGEASMLIV